MSSAHLHTFTATGIVRLASDLPVEAIGVALMECAADIDEKTSVSIDLDQSVIEIESIVTGTDSPDALANAKILIHRICECAEFPVQFAEHRKPCPSEWHVVDDSALPPLLASL